MSEIVIQSIIIPFSHLADATLKLRLYCSQTFITGGSGGTGKIIQAGSPPLGNFYQELSLTNSGNAVTIPQFIIDSTEDSQSNNTSPTYNAYFFSNDGVLIAPYQPFINFRVPGTLSGGSTGTWINLSEFNNNVLPRSTSIETLDSATILRLIAAVQGLPNVLTTTGDLIISMSGSSPGRLGIGTAGQLLTVVAGLPSWQTIAAVQSINGLTGAAQLLAPGGNFPNLTITPSGSTNTFQWVGQLAIARGGTGLSTIASGAILYASALDTLSTLPQAASGNALLSGSTPSWGKIGLSTHITGTLGVTNGGLGLIAVSTGELLYGSGANVYSRLAPVGAGNVLLSGTTPSWGKCSLTAAVSGILPGANGGTNNGFMAFTGPTTSLKTFTLPDASTTILTTNAAVTAVQGGIGAQTPFVVGDLLYADTTTTLAKRGIGSSNQVLRVSGGLPVYGAVVLTTDVSGILPLANGGTGQSSFGAGYITSNGSALASSAFPISIANGGTNAISFATSNGVAYYDGVGQRLVVTALGATGTVFVGTGAAPIFSSNPTITGITIAGLTLGSVPFAGTAGLISQNNARFFWDNTALPNGGLKVQDTLILLGGTNGSVGLKSPANGGDGAGGAITYTLPAAVGTDGQALALLSAASRTTSWQTFLTTAITSITGTSGGAQTGAGITFAVAATGTDFTIAGSGNTFTFAIPDASASARGLLTTSTQTLGGAKTLTNTLTLVANNTTVPPFKFQASVALCSPVIPHAFEWDGTDAYITSGASSRRTLAYRDSNITGSAASITGNLTGDVTSVGMATTYSAIVSRPKGGTGVALAADLTGTTGQHLQSNGTTLALSADGSGLTGLSATALATGSISAGILTASGAEQTVNKNQPSGYAGLSAGSKITASQITELLAVADLTDFAGKSGALGTFAVALNTGAAPTDGYIATYDSANQYWKASPPAAGTATYLIADAGPHTAGHIDTNANAVAVTQGALIIGNGTPKWDVLPIAGANTVLRSNGTTASWAALNVATDVTGILPLTNGGTGINAASNQALFNTIDPLTTKGDLIVNDGSNSVRQGIGSNDQILVADSTQTNGLRWGNPSMHPKQVVLKDEFAGGGITVASGIGELGWQGLGAATVTQPASVFPNIGLLQLTTGAVIGNGNSLSLGATANAVNGNLGGNTNWEVTYIFALTSTAAEVFHIGFTNNNTLTTNDPNGIYLTYNTDRGDTAFNYICKSGGVETKQTSGVAVDTLFHTLKIKSTTAGTVVFTIDGANTITISTNVPTATVGPFVMLETRAGFAKSVQFDYFLFNMTVTR